MAKHFSILLHYTQNQLRLVIYWIMCSYNRNNKVYILYSTLNRDDPQEMPVFVASNAAKENGNITPRGENLFAALK